MQRRKFLKSLALLSAAAAVPSCRNGKDGDEMSQAKSHKSGPMTTRVNHNTGDKVSLLGFGCMRFPLLEQTQDTENKEVDREEVKKLLETAIRGGVNYFDTAPVYCQGKSEEITGEALAPYDRKSYFLATKMSNFDPQTWETSKSKELFNNSLRYLRTPYIDYYLLHAIGGTAKGYDDAMQVFNARFIDNGILPWLVEQKDAGRIRNLGFSYHGDVKVFDHALVMMDRGEVHWDFVQIQHNYLDWRHAKEGNEANTNSEYLYSELEKRKIPVVVMEPLLGGRLSSVPGPVAAKMKVRRPNDSVASWAFRFAGSQPGILTVLSGMTYMEHLQDNLRTYSSLDPIAPAEDEFLQQMAMQIMLNQQIPCTGCAYCMPCPYGLDIPGIFAHYNKCINEDHLPRSSRDPEYAAARRAYLIGYDRAVPRLRQASHCIACNRCVSECPQSIPIPDRMADIAKYTQSLRTNTL